MFVQRMITGTITNCLFACTIRCYLLCTGSKICVVTVLFPIQADRSAVLHHTACASPKSTQASWGALGPPGPRAEIACARGGDRAVNHHAASVGRPSPKIRALNGKGRGRQGKWPVAVSNLRKFSSGGYCYPDHYTIRLHLEYYQSYDLSRELARGPYPVYTRYYGASHLWHDP